MTKTKKILISILLAMALCIPMGWVVPQADAAAILLNLKATWTANVESDVSGYFFFKTFDSQAGGIITPPNVWTGTTWSATDSAKIQLPATPTQLLFTAYINDTPTTGSLKFALKCDDTAGNISVISDDGVYSYNSDTVAPAKPSTPVITKQ